KTKSKMSGQVSLKLLFDKETKKLVYGEAGKDFVDFLLTILSLPLGTVTKLLAKKNMVGCLGNLYQSIEDLNDAYIIQSSTQNKNSILNPKGFYTPAKKTTLLPADGLSGTRYFYTCSNTMQGVLDIAKPKSTTQIVYYNRQLLLQHSTVRVTEDRLAICPDCNQPMNSGVQYRDAAYSERGFVKGEVSYMVMDNLEVKPMSTVSIMAAFNKVNIKYVGALEEKVVWLSSTEGLKILKASLTTEAVLSTLFLGE
ncbi:hypothetical protein LINGRAHAP2_LOCUS17691, partial [Linum grandiflorum]